MRKLWKDKQGALTLEYCLMASLILASLLTGAHILADDISGSLHNTACELVTGLAGHPTC